MAEFNYINGNYKSAVQLYSKVINTIPYKKNNYLNFAESYRNLNQYNKAINILKEGYLKSRDDIFYLQIALLYLEQKDNAKSNTYFEQIVLSQKKKPYLSNEKLSILKKLIEAQKLDYALRIINNFEKVSTNVEISMMRGEIYALQGDTEKMISYYLTLVNKNKRVYEYHVKRKIYRLIFYNQTSKEMVMPIIRKMAIENPDKLGYLDVLCWLYNNDKEYDKSFPFAKSLFLRKYWKYTEFYNYGNKIFRDNRFNVAKKVFTLLDNFKGNKNSYYEFEVKRKLLKSEFHILDKKNIPEMDSLDIKYKSIIRKYNLTNKTVDIIIDYSYFLAFFYNKKKLSLKYIDKILKEHLVKKNFKAKSYIAKGDIHSFYNEYIKAVLNYEKANKLGKRTEIEDIAKYKSAKISYYNGDFKWAKHLLNVFKKNTTRITSNDAIFLSLLIYNNLPDEQDIDSLKIPLKLYAKADLFKERQSYTQALEKILEIETNYSDNSIIDEALFLKATIYEENNELLSAEKTYKEIIEKFPYEFICESTLYNLSLFYIKNNNPSEAKIYIEKLLFEKQGSVYIPEVRELYKKLKVTDNPL